MSAEAAFVSLRNRNGVFTGRRDHEPHKGVAASGVTGLHKRVMVVVVDVADLDAAEVVTDVLERHPEQALVIFVVDLPFDLVRPQV